MLCGRHLRQVRHAGLSGGAVLDLVRNASHARLSEADVSHFEQLLGASCVIQDNEVLKRRNTYASALRYGSKAFWNRHAARYYDAHTDTLPTKLVR